MRKLLWPLAVAGAFLLGGAAAGVWQERHYRQTASLELLMEAIVEPASYAIFDAAVWSNGEPVNPPSTDADWETVEHGAITLAESANLMMMPGRAKDRGDWMTYSQDLHAGAVAAERAVHDRNLDRILLAGDQIYQACTNCHRKYLRPAE